MRPPFGVEQANRPYHGGRPSIRSRALLNWRNCDGTLAPLTQQAVEFGVRTSAATVFDSEGTSLSLPASIEAWSAEDWDGDGVREELLLLLGSEEYQRFLDSALGALRWPVLAFTLCHEFMWVGDGPLWSLSNNAGTGARLRLDAASGAVTWLHHNGTSSVSSTVGSGLSAGDKCSVRAEFRLDGGVQAWLELDGADEIAGTNSSALTPAGSWGGGSGVKARINEFGNASRGQQKLRSSALYPALLSRRDLLRLL